MKSKSVFKIILSILIILIVFNVIFFSIHNIIAELTSSNNKDDSFSCQLIRHRVSERNIILRLDDVQGNYLKDVQMKIINDVLDSNKTIVLGVIPTGILADQTTTNFLLQNRCKVEIALHGYTHNFNEFEKASYDLAVSKIKNGLTILNKIEPNVVTFIPPDNIFSDATEKALTDEGIEFNSASTWNSEFGEDISVYDWPNKKLLDSREVLKKCDEELDKTGFCVIMIHSQDYVTNGKLDLAKYSEFIDLLDGLDNLNATVIDFRDL